MWKASLTLLASLLLASPAYAQNQPDTQTQAFPAGAGSNMSSLLDIQNLVTQLQVYVAKLVSATPVSDTTPTSTVVTDLGKTTVAGSGGQTKRTNLDSKGSPVGTGALDQPVSSSVESTPIDTDSINLQKPAGNQTKELPIESTDAKANSTQTTVDKSATIERGTGEQPATSGKHRRSSTSSSNGTNDGSSTSLAPETTGQSAVAGQNGLKPSDKTILPPDYVTGTEVTPGSKVSSTPVSKVGSQKNPSDAVKQPPVRSTSTDVASTSIVPASEGIGTVATGGAGGKVIPVTNLNDSGSGSFRSCVDASGPRTCVFRVGGTIDLQTPIDVRNPDITIAGQTAPGGGILLKGNRIPGQYDGDGSAVMIVRTTNAIVQFLRIRQGEAPYGDEEGRGLYIGRNDDCNKIIIDHNSVSWASDQNVSQWGACSDLQLSYNIVSEGLMGHSMGMIIGANGDTNSKITGIKIVGNYFADNHGRNPYIGGAEQEVTRNIIYNWGYEGIAMRGGLGATVTDNLLVPGPDSNDHDIFYHDFSDSACEGSTYCLPGDPSITKSGNVTGNAGSSPLPAQILPHVGASMRLSCDGAWVTARDAVDTRVISQFTSGGGKLISSENEVGGFPNIQSGPACPDEDNDGMPTAWETRMGLDPSNPADGNAKSSQMAGATNLEVYLAGNDRQVCTTSKSATPTQSEILAFAAASGMTPKDVANQSQSSGARSCVNPLEQAANLIGEGPPPPPDSGTTDQNVSGVRSQSPANYMQPSDAGSQQPGDESGGTLTGDTTTSTDQTAPTDTVPADKSGQQPTRRLQSSGQRSDASTPSGNTVFAQEFNGRPGDKPGSPWQYFDAWGSDQWRDAVYDDKHAQLDGNGNLVITGDVVDGKLHTSYLQTYDSLNPDAPGAGKFGPGKKIEARIDMSKCGEVGSSAWCGFWLFDPTDPYDGNPSNGTEIDIIERSAANSWSDTKYSANSHNSKSGAHPGTWVNTDPNSGFHVYGVEWTKDKLTWTVDGRPVYSTTDGVSGSNNQAIILSIENAAGGNNPWAPGTGLQQGDKPTMVVDWVRVSDLSSSQVANSK